MRCESATEQNPTEHTPVRAGSGGSWITREKLANEIEVKSSQIEPNRTEPNSIEFSSVQMK